MSRGMGGNDRLRRNKRRARGNSHDYAARQGLRRDDIDAALARDRTLVMAVREWQIIRVEASTRNASALSVPGEATLAG